METTFGAGLGMCVLVVIFFLYMNRKWCFSNTSGNFPCCDEKALSTKTIHSFSKYLRRFRKLPRESLGSWYGQTKQSHSITYENSFISWARWDDISLWMLPLLSFGNLSMQMRVSPKPFISLPFSLIFDDGILESSHEKLVLIWTDVLKKSSKTNLDLQAFGTWAEDLPSSGLLHVSHWKVPSSVLKKFILRRKAEKRSNSFSRYLNSCWVTTARNPSHLCIAAANFPFEAYLHA